MAPSSVSTSHGYLVPGLIDGHTHLTCSASDRMVADAFEDDDLTATIRATDHAHAALRAGITTLRDCGSRHRVVNRLREAIRLGITQGPRLLLSGSVITTTGGHMYFVGREVDDPLELPRAVREQVRAAPTSSRSRTPEAAWCPGNGTAYLQFDRKALRLIIDEATQLGVHVAVHSLSTDGIAEVVEARPRTVEHLTFHKNSDEEIAYDGGLVDRLVERGLPGCQVIVGWHRRAHAAVGQPARTMWIPPRSNGSRTESRSSRTCAAAVCNSSQGRTPACRGPGSTTSGSSWICRYGTIGMSPAQSLLSATRDAAHVFGLDDRGVLTPGRLADVSVLRGNPVVDPEAFYGSVLTMVGGKVLWKAQEVGA